MSRTLVALPTGSNASWLDMPPSSPSLFPSRSPLLPRRQPRATPQMLSRIHALRHSLSIVKLSLNTRIHMLLSHQYSGFYCAHCTPRLTRGTCGPTCPLLRPYSFCGPFAYIADDDWYKQLVYDRAKYREVTTDMAARGTAVYASTVARWERAVSRLKKSVQMQSEMWEANGWPQVRGLDKKKVEFKREWTFQAAWGRGMGGYGDVEVAPEVKKRKFGESIDANGDQKLLETVRKRVKRI